MSQSREIESIANTLETYRSHLAAVSHALFTLRAVSEQMIEALDRDRAALATHLENAQPISPAGDSTADLAVAPATLTEPEAAADDTLHSVPLAIANALDENAATALAIEAALVSGILDTEPGQAVEQSESESEPLSESPAADITRVATNGAIAPLAIDIDVAATQAAPETPAIESAATVQAATNAAGNVARNVAGNVVDIASRRTTRSALAPARRRAAAIVASLLLCATATLGTYELMQTDLGQQIIQLSRCDGDALSAERDCALLAWLHI